MPRFSLSQTARSQSDGFLCSVRSAAVAAAVASVTLLALSGAAFAQDAAATDAPGANTAVDAAAPTTAPAAEGAAANVAPSTNIKADVEDFWHFAKLARYDAANAKAAALIAASPNPSEVLAAFEATANRGRTDDLTQYMVRFQATPELAQSAAGLQKILVEGRYARRADASFIEANIQRLITNQIGYQNGLTNLRNSGEMAVPLLLDYLRSPDRSQYHDAVRRAIRDLGRVALNPLVASTEMTDVPTLGLVITLLGDLGYNDAVPYLLKVQATNDSPAVKEAITRALSKLGGANTTPDAAFLGLAENFYYGKSAIAADNRNPNAFIWYWTEATGLLRKEVPQEVFGEIMGMRAAEYALQLAGANAAEVGDKAMSLWLAANYKRQVQLGEAVDPTRGEKQPDAHYYGVTSGPKYLGNALARTVNDKDSAVAFEILRSAQNIIGKSTLNVNAEGQSLVQALSYPDRKVRFEAAFTLAAARVTEPFSGSDSVVPLLGEALSQTGRPTVVVLAANTDKVNAIIEPLKANGYDAVGTTNATDINQGAQSLPSVEVVVFDGTLPGEQVQGILQQLATSPRLRGAARLALVQTNQSAFEELKARDPLLSTSTAAEPDAIRSAIEQARTKAGALAIEPDLATDYALRAAALLRQIGTTGGPYDLGTVKPTLLTSLNDPRPEVVTAVGRVLAQLNDADAQKSLLARGNATDLSPELRISLYKSLAENAKQFGSKLGTEEIGLLETTVTDEPDLTIRSAAAEARGALNLSADQAKSIILKQVQR